MSKRPIFTRIPLFGSRIPVPGAQAVSDVSVAGTSASQQTTKNITYKDIGKAVRVSEKEEGTLRFVGSVHFSEGIWCGIELSHPSGKNDGCVRGVRYFSCNESCGLMVKSYKVELVQISQHATSGPHSMLFGINDKSETTRNPLIRSTTYETLSNLPLDDLGDVDKPEGEHNPNLTYAKENQPVLAGQSSNLIYVKENKPLAGLNPNVTYTIENKPKGGLNPNLTYAKENKPKNVPNSSNVKQERVRGSLTYLNENNNCSSDDDVSSSSKSKRRQVFTKNEEHQAHRTFSLEHSSCTTRQRTPLGNSSGEHELGANEYVFNSKDNSSSIKIVQNRCSRQKPYDISSDILSSSKLLNKNIENEEINAGINKSLRFSEDFKHLPSSSTPNSKRFEAVDSVRRILYQPFSAPFSVDGPDNESKRNSWEESLGILQAEQMIDDCSIQSRTPSSENLKSLGSDLQNFISKFESEEKVIDSETQNLVDANTQEFSLGILDDNLFFNLTTITETTMNLELPLDSVDNKSKEYSIGRLEQTPSPEELPLDPTPVIESELKTEPSTSKTNSSFITSITSITSLDTGYQGDGEMSRPASRGPDHSPLTRRPLQRPLARRPEPMTDSDFYTESDADNHEEHVLRGGRLARVIDGTLYGVDPQAAADIYVNNRENMDSSGIFTDIEGNTRADELSSAENEPKIIDVSPSPSDTSTKTISNDSQNASAIINNEFLKSKLNNNCKKIMENVPLEVPAKRKMTSPMSNNSSPASIRSPKHLPREDVSKKHKIPKKGTVSKVKNSTEINNRQNIKEIAPNLVKKSPGRWDAVMNKISKSATDKKNLKEVKSKVFTSHTSTNTRQISTSKTPNAKLRRTRARPEVIPKNDIQASLNSSASDLSGASTTRDIGSIKKRGDVVRVTQVLTPGKLSPRITHKNLIENKKNIADSINSNDAKTPTRRVNISNNDNKKCIVPKDSGKATVKGGRASPGARPPQQNRVPVIATPKTLEALAVLVQHLVFNLEAFRTPSLKKDIERKCLELETANFTCKQMEESLIRIREEHVSNIEEERFRFKNEIADLLSEQQRQIATLNMKHTENMEHVVDDHVNEQNQLILIQNEQLIKLREEYNKLQLNHLQTLEILREENDSIREEIDDKNALIEQLQKMQRQNDKLEADYRDKDNRHKIEIEILNKKIASIQTENGKIVHQVNGETKEKDTPTTLAEVESLRAVLDLKHLEVTELRRSLAEANQKREMLPGLIEKVSLLTARCEDLESQLESKSAFENELVVNNKKLSESLKNESYQYQRLSQVNEELQWKLRQNQELLNRVIERTEEASLNRSILTASFNERHGSPKSFERTMSVRDRSSPKSFVESSKKCKKMCDLDDLTQFSSPNVKSVVKKSDSVSYLLDLDDSPEMKANRIVRRSFRNSTSPNSASTKSPSNKRPRMRNNPLSLSASVGAIVPVINPNHLRSHSLSMRENDTGSVSSNSDDVFTWPVSSVRSSTPNGKQKMCHESDNSCMEDNNELDEFDDIKLPVLPSEIGRNPNVQSLPVPKHLAGEAMISESNSEDESTTSSSSAQL